MYIYKSKSNRLDLAEAMSRANNSAQIAGVGMDTYIAYLTTVADVTQRSSETIGEAFKTIFSFLYKCIFIHLYYLDTAYIQ